MILNFGDWSITGIVAALAIVVGSILLVVYAVRRGLVRSEERRVGKECVP